MARIARALTDESGALTVNDNALTRFGVFV